MAIAKLSASAWSYLGLALVLAFFGLMIIGSIVNITDGLGAMRFGGAIYVIGLLATILGFATKEDHVAIGGITGLNLLVVLDIALNIGVLYHW